MSDEQNAALPVVIDLGAASTRIGFAGEEFPEMIVPTEVARVRNFRFKRKIIPALDDLLEDLIKQDFFFGDDINRFKQILDTTRFIATRDWVALKRFLQYLLAELKLNPQQTPCIIISPEKTSADFTEQLKHIMFEFFNAPKIFFIPSAFCVLYALQVDSGVVVSLGERHTVVRSVLKGFESEEGSLESDVTGEHITRYFGELATKIQPNPLSSPKDLQAIKDQVVLFVRDVEGALKSIENGSTKFELEITLPTAEHLRFEKERFLAVEPYFQPERIGSSSPSLSTLIVDAIKQWGIAQRPELASKIVLAGGGSLIPNISERLDYELKKSFPNMDVKIIAPAGRENLDWIGASLFAGKGLIGDKWIVNKNWEQNKQKNAPKAEVAGEGSG